MFTQYSSAPSAAFAVEPSGQCVYPFRVLIHASGTPFEWPVISKRRSSGSENTNSPSRFRNEISFPNSMRHFKDCRWSPATDAGSRVAISS